MPGLKCTRRDCPRARECIRFLENYRGEDADLVRSRPDVQRIELKTVGEGCEFYYPIREIMK